MKLRTNFYPPIRSLAVLGAILAWGVVLLGLCGAVVIALDSFHLKARIVSLSAQWAVKAQVPLVQAPVSGMPAPKELDGLKDRLKQLNGLAVGQVSSVPVLLTQLEKYLPADTRLLNLQYDRSNGQVQLSAESMNMDSVSTFLSALEKDDHFSGVNLAHQSAGTDGSKVQFSVDMVCR